MCYTIHQLTANVDTVLNQSGGNGPQSCVCTADNASPNLENQKKKTKKKNKGGYKGKTHLNKRNNNLENLIKTAEFKQKMLESLLKKM